MLALLPDPFWIIFALLPNPSLVIRGDFNQSDGGFTMKFIKVAALAAIVVSGSAMAGLIDQGGWGHGHGHGHGQGGKANRQR